MSNKNLVRCMSILALSVALSCDDSTSESPRELAEENKIPVESLLGPSSLPDPSIPDFEPPYSEELLAPLLATLEVGDVTVQLRGTEDDSIGISLVGPDTASLQEALTQVLAAPSPLELALNYTLPGEDIPAILEEYSVRVVESGNWLNHPLVSKPSARAKNSCS